MSHERDSNGGPRTGDDGDDFAAPEEPTVVIVPDEFLLGAFERLAGGLRRAADRCDGFGALVDEAGAALAIAEVIEELGDLEITIGGAKRGAQRLEREFRKKKENDR